MSLRDTVRIAKGPVWCSLHVCIVCMNRDAHVGHWHCSNITEWIDCMRSMCSPGLVRIRCAAIDGRCARAAVLANRMLEMIRGV